MPAFDLIGNIVRVCGGEVTVEFRGMSTAAKIPGIEGFPRPVNGTIDEHLAQDPSAEYTIWS
jgi:hypothetical protein